MKKIILLVPLFLLTSCAQKWGVYTIMHEEKLPNGCSVRTIRHEDIESETTNGVLFFLFSRYGKRSSRILKFL